MGENMAANRGYLVEYLVKILANSDATLQKIIIDPSPFAVRFDTPQGLAPGSVGQFRVELSGITIMPPGTVRFVHACDCICKYLINPEKALLMLKNCESLDIQKACNRG